MNFVSGNLRLAKLSAFSPVPSADQGVVIVPQQKAFVVERFGKFHRKLDPGLHFLIPIVDQVAYVHSLKEDAITIASQTAVTRDNVVLSIDGVLYVRIVDPEKASYGVADVHYALTQLAQTTMRSEVGRRRAPRAAVSALMVCAFHSPCSSASSSSTILFKSETL